MFPSIFDTLEEVLDNPPPDADAPYWGMLAELESADDSGRCFGWRVGVHVWNERGYCVKCAEKRPEGEE